MSGKEAILELVRNVPDDATAEQILQYLHVQVANRGASEESWGTEELSNEQWQEVIAHSLEKELADAREDIYSSKDGEPIDGQR